MYTGHQIIKAFGREEESIARFNQINDELYEVGWKAQFMSGIIVPLLSLINNIGYGLVSVVGGIFVINRTITIGDVQAFIQYSRQFTQPIVQTANIVNTIQSTIASAESVFEILDETEEVADSDNAQHIAFPQGIENLQNVKFSLLAQGGFYADLYKSQFSSGNINEQAV